MKKNNQLFLDVRELSELVPHSYRTVQCWATQGKIPGAVKIGGRWNFKRQTVLKALQKPNFLLED